MAADDSFRRGTTIYSVADHAGVSIATVSRVLQGSPLVSEKTRRKVLEAVDELDYLPSGAARSLAVRHHDTYGLVLPELGGPYYSDLLAGFETRAAELHQSVMLVLAGTKEDRGQALRTLATRVDGIAVLGADATHVGRTAKPVVVIAGQARPGVEAIAAENVESARDLTEHLLQHGRTRLLFVGDPDAAPDVSERYEGFVAAHRDRGLAAAEPVLAEFREREGVEVAERLLAGDFQADALVCGNDELALADHVAPHGRRRRRPRRHRRRRLGRRHDGPVRPTGPDDRPPARAPGRGPRRRPPPPARQRRHPQPGASGPAHPGRHPQLVRVSRRHGRPPHRSDTPDPHHDPAPPQKVRDR